MKDSSLLRVAFAWRSLCVRVCVEKLAFCKVHPLFRHKYLRINFAAVAQPPLLGRPVLVFLPYRRREEDRANIEMRFLCPSLS